MSQHRLAILGASVRAAARSAVRAGYLPVAADLFADEDLRQHCPATRIQNYPAGLVDWLAATDCDGWMYSGALENRPELIDHLASLRPLWGNGGPVLRRVRSPRLLREALADAGLRFPDTRDSADGLPRDGTWLVKTYRGSSGSGVRSLDGNAPPAAGAVFQRRIDGLPLAAVFVAAAGEAQLIGVTRQLVGDAWTGGGPFQYVGSIGPWPVEIDTVRTIGQTLAARFQLVGLFGVDMVAGRDGVWTVEVNPRYTASVEIVEQVTGVDATAQHVAACREGRLLPLPTAPVGGAVGKAVLFARQPVCVSPEFVAWALAGSRQQPWPTVGDVPSAGTSIDAGRPVATQFASGSDAADVERGLKQQCDVAERMICAEAPCEATPSPRADRCD